MTLHALESLIQDLMLEQTAYAQRGICGPGEYKPVGAARAALLRAVEGIVRERDEARHALHGTSQFVGPCPHGADPWTRCDECEGRTSVQVLLARAEAAEQKVREALASIAVQRDDLIKARTELHEVARRAERAEAALVARHGGEPLALLAELDEAREALKAAEKERDEAEQKLAQSEDRVIAIGTDLARSESALAAMREAMEGLLDSMVTDHDACALCLRDLSNHASGCPIVSARTALASPPPAAMSTDRDAEGNAALRQPDCYCSDLGKHPLGSRGCKHQRIG